MSIPVTKLEEVATAEDSERSTDIDGMYPLPGRSKCQNQESLQERILSNKLTRSFPHHDLLSRTLRASSDPVVVDWHSTVRVADLFVID